MVTAELGEPVVLPSTYCPRCDAPVDSSYAFPEDSEEQSLCPTCGYTWDRPDEEPKEG